MIFIRGGSWAGYPVFMLLLFLFYRCCFMVVLCFLCMCSPSLFKLVHLQSNTQIQKQNNKQQILDENIIWKRKTKKQKYIISQPEPERYLFAVGSWAGYRVFLVVFFSKLFCFVYVFVCVLCFRLVYSSFCLNTTQYTTLNTNKLEMCLFMTCVNCSKWCSN